MAATSTAGSNICIANGVDDTLRTPIALEGFKSKRLAYLGAYRVVA